jgi:DNA (cytosine-5)-methyltransferase 1
MPRKRKIKFVDLFAGLGGFHLAAAALGAECVFACEIDEELRDLYETNFGVRPQGDITQISPHDIPPHDLLCAGFPCQPFSKAGAQLGLDDAVHGKLFYDIIKILQVHRPEFVILENIAHFVNHDEGNTYRELQDKLRELGYDIRVTKLSPHQFGVPQIRERMYLVARHGSLDGFEFPQKQTTADQLSIRSVLDENPADARRLSNHVIECLNLWQEFLSLYPSDEKLPGRPIWTMEFGATYPYDRGPLHDINLSSLQKYQGSFGQSLKGLSLNEILERVPSHARDKRNPFPTWKQKFIQRNRDFYLKHRSWLDTWLPKIQLLPSSHQKLEWHCKEAPRDIWNYIIRFRA